jgi:ABC-type branched-subunit amino acid transport system permease subunit
MTAKRILTHPLLWTAVVFVILPRVAGANPFTGQSGFVDIATTMLIFGLVASGFNLLLGHVGELSFGHAMFFAIGAYATALTVKGFSVNILGFTWTHAANANMWVALLISLVFVFVWALERRLLFDDHAGVCTSRVLHRIHLE